MDKRLFGPAVESIVENFFKAAYGALVGLEWALIERNVIGLTTKEGVYDDAEEFGEIH